MPDHRETSDAASAVDWHALDAEAVLVELGSSRHGLSGVEATARLERYGPNAIPTAPPTPGWQIFLRQLRSPLIAILAVACVITALQQHWVDSTAIFLVLLLAAGLGFWQERKAERDVRALQSLSTTTARVLRDGSTVELAGESLVPGDVVTLESGDRVPADLRLLQANGLRVDESMLTGESEAVDKDASSSRADAALGDRTGMAFNGTLVTSGRGIGVVAATALETELGAISRMISGRPPATPLQRLMHRLERGIGITVLVAVVLVLILGLLVGHSLEDMFRVAVALAVAAIPESLPVILTVAMSVGVSRMARRGVIVRSLPAIETLGSTTVIASDKTGTLTQNRLTVERLWSGGRFHDADALGDDPAEVDEPLRELLRAGALANEAKRSADGELIGDAVDVAMARVALDLGALGEAERSARPVAFTPYEPTLAYAQTVREVDGRRVLYVKGAPGVLFGLCHRMAGADGEVSFDRSAIRDAIDRMAADGMRVLGTAARILDEGEELPTPLPEPRGMTFLGLEGMTDPPRPGVIEAVDACHAAGITVKMVTGDHPTTADAIARRLGIESGPAPITGAEMAELDDEALTARLRETNVAARVAPRDKLRIVRVLQEADETVAVTGDGVNDAPALNAASIGVAMGESGTDVAREAADFVLTDDNFATIVDAVEQGRVTFAAIRKATFFLLSTAVAGILSLALNVLLGQPLLFLPVQILWINLVTSGIQDIALAFEPAEGNELARPPRRRTEGILSTVLWIRVIVTGVWMGLCVLGVFWWALEAGYALEHARSLAMTTFVLFNFFQVGNARAEYRSLFALSPLRNKLLMVTAVVAIGLLWLVMALPITAELFGLVPLSFAEWVVAALIGSTVVILVEGDKLIRALLQRRRV